jgi:hypothetical protein
MERLFSPASRPWYLHRTQPATIMVSASQAFDLTDSTAYRIVREIVSYGGGNDATMDE